MASSFSPLSLSPALWLDASDAATVTLVSSAVSQWNDKSANARHATQTTSTKRAGYTSATSVNFTGVTYLDVPATVTQYDFFLLHTTHSSNASFRSILRTGLQVALGGNTGSDSIGAYYNAFASAGTRAVNTKGLTAGRMDAGGNVSMSLNGAGFGSTLVTFSDSRNITILGNETGGTQPGGSFHELLVLPALSTTDFQKVEGYLAHKWGTAASLPAGHPYKNSAP